MIVCNFVDLHRSIQNMESAISNLSFFSEPTIKDRCEWVLDDIINKIVINHVMCKEIITDIIETVIIQCENESSQKRTR